MDITNKTTVKQLIAMGITKSQIENLVARAQRKANKSQVNEERQAFMEEVFALMLANPEMQWKNGKLLKNWFPDGKSADEEVEKARRAKHAEISRALQSLSEAGRISKHNKTNTASGTFYTVELQLPAVQNANDKADDSQE